MRDELWESHRARLQTSANIVDLANADDDALRSFEIEKDWDQRALIRRRRGGSTTGSYKSSCLEFRYYPSSSVDTPGVRIENLDGEDIVAEEDIEDQPMVREIVLRASELLEAEFKMDLPDMYGRFWQCDPRATVAKVTTNSRGIGCGAEGVPLAGVGGKVTGQTKEKKKGRRAKDAMPGKQSSESWTRPTHHAVASFFGSSNHSSRSEFMPPSPFLVTEDSPVAPADAMAHGGSHSVSDDPVPIGVQTVVEEPDALDASMSEEPEAPVPELHDPVSVLSAVESVESHDPSAVKGAGNRFAVNLTAAEESIILCPTCPLAGEEEDIPSHDRCASPTQSYHSSSDGDLRMVGGTTLVYRLETPPEGSEVGSDGAVRSDDCNVMWEAL